MVAPRSRTVWLLGTELAIATAGGALAQAFVGAFSGFGNLVDDPGLGRRPIHVSPRIAALERTVFVDVYMGALVFFGGVHLVVYLVSRVGPERAEPTAKGVGRVGLLQLLLAAGFVSCWGASWLTLLTAPVTPRAAWEDFLPWLALVGALSALLSAWIAGSRWIVSSVCGVGLAALAAALSLFGSDPLVMSLLLASAALVWLVADRRALSDAAAS